MNENISILMEEQKKEDVQNKLGFHSFEEVKEQYNNAVDLSDSNRRKWSYKEVTQYLESIVNDVMVTSDGHKIAISDDYNHIVRSANYTHLNRRNKEEIKTYAAEIKTLISNSEFQKEIDNKDSAKVDVEKFKYYTVPVWINNRAYNVLLECGQLKNETSDNAARNGATEVNVHGSYNLIQNETSDSATRQGVSNDTFSEVSKEKYIRKYGKLQVLDISYLYNIKNRPLINKNQINNDNSKFNQLASEYNSLLKEYDENINDYNTLLSAYNKVQEENRILKNQNHLQER